MKNIKTSNYKKIKISQYVDELEERKKRLAVKLLEWHGGQSSPLYSVGSTWLVGKELTDSNIINNAIEELEDIVQKRVNHPETITNENIIEVKQLQKELKEVGLQIEGKRKSDYLADRDNYRADTGNWGAF